MDMFLGLFLGFAITVVLIWLLDHKLRKLSPKATYYIWTLFFWMIATNSILYAEEVVLAWIAFIIGAIHFWKAVYYPGWKAVKPEQKLVSR